MSNVRKYRVRYFDVYGKITDGENFVSKKLATVSNFVSNRYYCKLLKIKPDEIENYKKHVVYTWYHQVMASPYSPEWVRSNNSNITIMSLHMVNKGDNPLKLNAYKNKNSD